MASVLRGDVSVATDSQPMRNAPLLCDWIQNSDMNYFARRNLLATTGLSPIRTANQLLRARPNLPSNAVPIRTTGPSRIPTTLSVFSRSCGAFSSWAPHAQTSSSWLEPVLHLLVAASHSHRAILELLLKFNTNYVSLVLLATPSSAAGRS